MSSLLDRMLKTNAGGMKPSVLSDSEFFKDLDIIQTDIPSLNIALGGELTSGYHSGLVMISGASKSFKCLGPDTKIIVYVDD